MLWLTVLFACNSKMDEATVKGVVDKAFKEANPTEGHYGWELIGKGQWFKGNDFVVDCLIENELAYPNYKKPGQITPGYNVQNMLTASSKKGYCIDFGERLSYTIDKIEHVSEMGSMDIQNVHLRFELENSTPWVQCLKEGLMERVVRVENRDGTPMLNPDDSVALQQENGCPNPIPAYEKRLTKPRPETAPPQAPTVAEAKKLAQDFDDALFARDFEKAYGMLSCVNLFESNKWGTCSLSELLPLGPSTHGESRVEDGAPWLEYTQYNLDSLERVVKDKTDPTLFHVIMPHRKNKQKRSFSVQWANGRWKLLGMISIQGSGLTAFRLMNDLHDKIYRDAFEKRLAGEEVDYRGVSLNPPE